MVAEKASRLVIRTLLSISLHGNGRKWSRLVRAIFGSVDRRGHLEVPFTTNTSADLNEQRPTLRECQLPPRSYYELDIQLSAKSRHG